MINFPFHCQGPTTGDLLKVVGVEVKIGDVSEVKRQHMGCLQKPSKVPRSWLILRISTVVDYLIILNNINILLCAWICIKSLMVFVKMQIHRLFFILTKLESQEVFTELKNDCIKC